MVWNKPNRINQNGTINIKGTIKLETVWCKEGLMQSDHELGEPSLGSLSLRSIDR